MTTCTPGFQCAPVRAPAAAAQVLQGILRPDRPTRMGTARTVNVPVKAPRDAVVSSSPIACRVYPPTNTCDESPLCAQHFRFAHCSGLHGTCLAVSFSHKITLSCQMLLAQGGYLLYVGYATSLADACVCAEYASVRQHDNGLTTPGKHKLCLLTFPFYGLVLTVLFLHLLIHA